MSGVWRRRLLALQSRRPEMNVSQSLQTRILHILRALSEAAL